MLLHRGFGLDEHLDFFVDLVVFLGLKALKPFAVVSLKRFGFGLRTLARRREHVLELLDRRGEFVGREQVKRAWITDLNRVNVGRCHLAVVQHQKCQFGNLPFDVLHAGRDLGQELVAVGRVEPLGDARLCNGRACGARCACGLGQARGTVGGVANIGKVLADAVGRTLGEVDDFPGFVNGR